MADVKVQNSRAFKRLASLEQMRRGFARASANNPIDNADLVSGDPNFPTVATVSATDAALTSVYTMVNNRGVFRVGGGIPLQRTDTPLFTLFPVTKVGNGVNGATGTIAAGNMLNWTDDNENYASVWDVSFSTDALKVEIAVTRQTAGRPYFVYVNNRFVTARTGILTAAADSGNGRFITLTFTDKRPRTITIRGFGAMQFENIKMLPTDSVSYPYAVEELCGIFTGDSQTEGQGVFAYQAQAAIMSQLLGVQLWFNMAIGATGYRAGPGDRRNFLQQITDSVRGWARNGFPWSSDAAIPRQPHFVSISHGFNDKASTANTGAVADTYRADVKQKAIDSWKAIRALFPNTLIIVNGGVVGRSGPSNDTKAMENLIRTWLTEWGDDFYLFIPFCTDTVPGAEPYQKGTGYIGATTGIGNADTTVGTDGTHLSVLGHQLYAHRYAGDIRRAVQNMPVSLGI